MPANGQCADEVVVIGGGVSGLSVAAVLARNEIPVTLLEASTPGAEASTRNQGWLYSGALFARRQPKLARMCLDSYRKTIEFCPECLEPGHTGMTFAITRPETDRDSWTDAWGQAGIPFENMSTTQLRRSIPGLETGLIQSAFHLPDRSFRPQVLLRKLATVAAARGVRIRTRSRVTAFEVTDGRITTVRTCGGDQVRASFVIIATGASQSDLSRYLGITSTCDQSLYQRVTLQAHLMSVAPQLSSQPFCMVDSDGFNHMPHMNPGDRQVSVLGADTWKVVNALESDVPCTEAANRIRSKIHHFFPGFDLSSADVQCWSARTVQAMHLEQTDPGRVPLPTVINHSMEAPCISNMISIYPGRATLWPQLAEQAASVVKGILEPRQVAVSDPPWA